MTTLEITLIVILYIIMLIIIGKKQYEAIGHDEGGGPVAFILAILWPITMFFYIIRAVFFEKWY